eukprot:TRINITY_DN97002_c0_g1_i1.p1 TRINITY_DN97002_c0_g1~~TRINITY_DN97002_c0_g1_i1.p1  ORF type:complete len:143 (+),score=8.91 TRINITY_DN97002_c0_g1_i1:68-496(+)
MQQISDFVETVAPKLRRWWPGIPLDQSAVRTRSYTLDILNTRSRSGIASSDAYAPSTSLKPSGPVDTRCDSRVCSKYGSRGTRNISEFGDECDGIASRLLTCANACFRLESPYNVGELQFYRGSLAFGLVFWTETRIATSVT